jgi:hypothetical protein
MSYYLNSESPPGCVTGCVELFSPYQALQDLGVVPFLEPFLDMRFMHDREESMEDMTLPSPEVNDTDSGVQISREGKSIIMLGDGLEFTRFQDPHFRQHQYRLGSGLRTVAEGQTSRGGGALVFAARSQRLPAYGYFHVRPNRREQYARLFFSCGEENVVRNAGLEEISCYFAASHLADRNLWNTTTSGLGAKVSQRFRNQILARVVTWTKHRMIIEGGPGPKRLLIPPAGGWRFKTPSHRDVFEGLWNNFQTLTHLPDELQNTVNLVKAVLRTQDDNTGRIPSLTPTSPGEPLRLNSADATLLAILVGHECLEEGFDHEMAALLLHALNVMIRCCETNNKEIELSCRRELHCRIDPVTGLLLSVPSHSWIDARADRTVKTDLEHGESHWITTRLSSRFLEQLYSKLERKSDFENVLESPNFYLPEINALWIAVLSKTALLARLDDLSGNETQREGRDVAALAKKAVDLARNAFTSFLSVFGKRNAPYLVNAVYFDRVLKDELDCETGITALAILGKSILKEDQIRAAVHYVKRRLLEGRRRVELDPSKDKLAFGVIVKQEPAEPFRGDLQYHGRVIWPRSMPYLIKLMELGGDLSDFQVIEEILKNVLDHQMSEGVLFSTQELFSLAEGFNPERNDETAGNPVPVQNPMQFWSQWCDPFLVKDRKLEAVDAKQEIYRQAVLYRQVVQAGSAVRSQEQGLPVRGPIETTDPFRMQIKRESARTALHAPENVPLLFVSYARANKEEMAQLVTNLTGLKRSGKIDLFYDDNLEAGERWPEQIAGKIKCSRIVVLLVTSEFIASGPVNDQEIPAILERKRAFPELRIVPIIAKHCAWRVGLHRDLVPKDTQVFPINPDLPLWEREGGDIRRALQQVTEQIAQLADRLRKLG